MKYYCFRNSTIEILISGIDVRYSGYGDISEIPDADRYIWFYTIPLKANLDQVADEISNFETMLNIVYSKINRSKQLFIITLKNTFSISCLINNPIEKSIQNFNNAIYELADLHSNIKILPIDSFYSNYSLHSIIDWKYYFLSQIPINPKFSKNFSFWLSSQFNAIDMKRKKCIILDLDNTIWGGIIGEDGISGIQIGNDYPGNCFLLFQQYILELSKSGVLIAICSKNNLEDVKNVWLNHPYNLIKEEHIACYKINWNNKADNIIEISKELNLGTDSFVFIDDNPSERDLVRGMISDIMVPEFPENPHQIIPFIKDIIDTYFKTYIYTNEDLNKLEQYKLNAKRLKEQEKFQTFDAYIKNLEIIIEISEATELTVSRISQMCQKTNQFNLTTKRYTEPDIFELINNGHILKTLSIRDKFGDHGITGLIIIKISSDIAEIDSFLLSCRILGKGIEFEFIKYCINDVFNLGKNKIFGTYIPTLKNIQVEDFYEKIGFTSLGQGRYLLEKENFEYIPNCNYQIINK